MCTTKRAAFIRHLALPVAVCIATVGAGCLGAAAFPDQVPVHGDHQRWVDRPLEQTIEQQREEIGEVLTGFLRQRREIACRVDDTRARRQAVEQAVEQASARVMHSHSRAELQGERMAMISQIASAGSQSKEINLTRIVAFDEADGRPKQIDVGLLPFQCERHVDDACIETLGQRSMQMIYARLFDDSSISRAAIAEVLPVLRRDLEWGLSQIGDDASREEVSPAIKELCLAGKSPLANYLMAHENADDDQLSSLVRRLGGNRPCNEVAGIYEVLLRSIAADLRASKSEQVCTVDAAR